MKLRKIKICSDWISCSHLKDADDTDYTVSYCPLGCKKPCSFCRNYSTKRQNLTLAKKMNKHNIKITKKFGNCLISELPEEAFKMF